jgi:Domain of unknown function (DUF397)
MGENVRGMDWRKSSYSNASGNCVEVGMAWRKSTHSNASGDCVEVGTARRAILVRDTTNRSGATLTVPAEAWQALLAKVRAS